MNEAQRINSDIYRSSTRMGVIVLLIVLAAFLFKSVTGYVKVTKEQTYENCAVQTWSEEHRNSKGGTYHVYYLEISHGVSNKTDINFGDLYKNDDPLDYDMITPKESTEKEILFSRRIPYLYYSKFQSYNKNQVTMFKTEHGTRFPVYKLNCSEAEAEREYRRLDPPLFWYTAYVAGIFLGLLLLKFGHNAKRTADNYSDNVLYENKPDEVVTREDALAAMATMRIRREKEEERNRRRNNRFTF
ncbi:hypothetical protein [uncultured Ruminococcus sp.]|uniref:hypothetical protein n=1 Tax=uncultured Ruminococcus sp. TaxID=165186 RepID=UPI0025FD9ED3|nr:hypothetical protein [uncultured Ruminococcus sp.]